MPVDNKSNTGKLSFARVLLFAVALAILLIIVEVLLFEQSLTQNVVDEIATELNQRTVEIENYTQEQTSHYIDNLRFLHATSAVSELAKASLPRSQTSDTTTIEQWKSRLETTFIAFIENNKEVDQLRIINVEGREVVRVERLGGRVAAISDINLQEKGTRDYFEASSQLSRNEVYMSPISLNREYGKVEYPHKPVFRLSLPIFEETGERYGFIIMNNNASYILQGMANFVSLPRQLYVTDENGHFILHPQKRFQFTKDLSPEITWQSQFNTAIQEGVRQIAYREKPEELLYVDSRKVTVSNTSGSQFVYLHLTLPEQSVVALMNERRVSVYVFVLAISFLFGGLLIVFHRSAKSNFQLAEARGESAAIVAGSSDMIISMDNHGVIKSWNAAAERFFRISNYATVGHHFESFEVLAPLMLDNYVGDNVVFESRLEDQVVYLHPTGKETYLAISVSPILGDHSQFSGVAIVIRDVSEEYKARNDIERLNSELEEKVVVRTKELAEARDEAQKASNVKSAFISNISHEMRTPLNGLAGSLNLLKRQPLAPKTEQLVSMMDISCNNLSVLINDILDISKIEAGKLDLDISAFNPIELIESVATTQAEKALEKDLEVLLDITALPNEKLYSDQYRISQIINNLVSNAIKFTEKGHILISAALSECSQQQYELHISVTDTGIGISEQNKDRLFSAFSQADTTITNHVGGTGLGLSICKQLCLLLHGDISFTSDLGKGSTFSFWVTVQSELPFNHSTAPKPKGALNNKQLAVFAQYSPLIENICSLIASSDGKVSDIYTDSIEVDKVPWDRFDYVIIDEGNPIIDKLDRAWSSLSAIPMPLLIVIQPLIKALPNYHHITPIVVNKPFCISAFLRAINLNGSGECVVKEREKSERSLSVKRAKASGAHILIVDDNPINIEVAKGILDNLSILISTAQNGYEALKQLRQCEESGDYIHCILMDCQMPEMDGYTCTRQLRSGLAGHVHQHVPIIAMTANAMLGEREKCLEAGMNDYVTKPVNAASAEPKILHWILSNINRHSLGDSPPNISHNKGVVNNEEKEEYGTQVEVALGDSKMTSQEQDNTNMPIWDRESALQRMANNEVLLGKICAMFGETAPEKLQMLTNAVTNENVAEIKLISHTLKGMSGDIGATQLYSDFDEIEQYCKVPDIAKIEEKLILTRKHFDAFLKVFT